MTSLKTWKVSLAALTVLAFGCAVDGADELDTQVAELAATAPVGAGVRTSLTSVYGAENTLFTSTGRLFVSGDKGLYELVKNADASITKTQLATPSNCQFGGLTEARGVVYANCYGGVDSSLYAAALAPVPAFRQIATLSGHGFANGLTSDPEGRLYIAATWQNQILRYTLSATDPFTVTVRETWLNSAGPLVNGIKYYAGFIYWTNGLSINRISLRPDGYHDQAHTLVTAATVFDDLMVDEQGIVAADSTGNVLRQYDLTGRLLGVTPATFSGPSSVARALGRAGFGQTALIVSERAQNRVSEFDPQ